MVRLLLYIIFVIYSLADEFQSHNGAIAAWQVPLRRLTLADVSIPQWCDCCGQTDQHCQHRHLRFNPTMVRLLLQKAL